MRLPTVPGPGSVGSYNGIPANRNESKFIRAQAPMTNVGGPTGNPKLTTSEEIQVNVLVGQRGKKPFYRHSLTPSANSHFCSNYFLSAEILIPHPPAEATQSSWSAHIRQLLEISISQRSPLYS